MMMMAMMVVVMLSATGHEIRIRILLLKPILSSIPFVYRRIRESLYVHSYTPAYHVYDNSLKELTSDAKLSSRRFQSKLQVNPDRDIWVWSVDAIDFIKQDVRSNVLSRSNVSGVTGVATSKASRSRAHPLYWGKEQEER